MNNYLVPITHAVWRCLPAGAFSNSKGWLHRIVSVFKTYKSLEGMIFLKERPLPSYPPNKYTLLPIRFAVCPLKPFGGLPQIWGSVQLRVSVSNTCKSLRCLFPEWPPKRYSFVPSTVIVWAFLAIGIVPETCGEIQVIVSKSRMSMSLKHFSPSYPPNIYSLRPTLDIVWQALADGFWPLTFGLLHTKLDVFKT